LNSSFGFAEVHGLVAGPVLGAPHQEKQSYQQQDREEQAAEGFYPEAFVALGQNGNIYVIFGQDVDQFWVVRQVNQYLAAVLSRYEGFAAIGTDIYFVYSLAFDFLNELAVLPNFPAWGLFVKKCRG